MELLNQKVIDSNSFELLKLMLQKISNNNEHLIQYSNFKETIISFVEEIMKTYLKDAKYLNDEYSCIIEKMPKSRFGEFNSKNNTIIINETIIQDIYSGNIDSMITIFHELNHFKSKYDIILGKVNNDIIRTIKEDLLRIANQEFFNKSRDDSYYNCNYEMFSDEKIAEINAINNLIDFLKLTNIKLSEQHLQQLKTRIKNNINQYNNYLRDLRLVLNYNNNFLDFEELFDITIKRNPNWLVIPQLNIEYYLDTNGKVAKRTKQELEERLKTETDEDIKKYIQFLLTPNNKKRLEKSEFFEDIKTIKINKFYKNSSINSSLKK